MTESILKRKQIHNADDVSGNYGSIYLHKYNSLTYVHTFETSVIF